jgi:hypothetical protein
MGGGIARVSMFHLAGPGHTPERCLGWGPGIKDEEPWMHLQQGALC